MGDVLRLKVAHRRTALPLGGAGGRVVGGVLAAVVEEESDSSYD